MAAILTGADVGVRVRGPSPDRSASARPRTREVLVFEVAGQMLLGLDPGLPGW